MSSELSELQARQAVQRLHQQTAQVKRFTSQAKLLSSLPQLDALLLLTEANVLMKGLIESRSDFLNLKAASASLSRSLSSRPPAQGGLSPAAKWRPELQAASKQFLQEITNAEKAIKALTEKAKAAINLPTRTATGPDGVLDVVLNLIEILRMLVEYCKRKK